MHARSQSMCNGYLFVRGCCVSYATHASDSEVSGGACSLISVHALFCELITHAGSAKETSTPEQVRQDPIDLRKAAREGDVTQVRTY
jgi:hypothetical protein